MIVRPHDEGPQNILKDFDLINLDTRNVLNGAHCIVLLRNVLCWMQQDWLIKEPTIATLVVDV